jgi:hypothetical protein
MDFGISFNQAMALIIGTGILVGTLLIWGWVHRDKKTDAELADQNDGGFK